MLVWTKYDINEEVTADPWVLGGNMITIAKMNSYESPGSMKQLYVSNFHWVLEIQKQKKCNTCWNVCPIFKNASNPNWFFMILLLHLEIAKLLLSCLLDDSLQHMLLFPYQSRQA